MIGHHGNGHGHGHGHGHRHDAGGREATRALLVSLVVLLVTAFVQGVVVVATSSVGLLADALHNVSDALTAIPLGFAFVLGRRSPTDRFTFGFGRAEDLAGVAVVATIGISVALTAAESIRRLITPHGVNHLGTLAAAGCIGFLGNELAAIYRIRVGRRIGSAALTADGHHARVDGFASLAVVVGAAAVAAGWERADPVVGLAISGVMGVVLVRTGREILLRLMDSTDPTTTATIRSLAAQVGGVRAVERIRLRWIGHELCGELDIVVEPTISVRDGHRIAEEVHHALLHAIDHLGPVTIHTDPAAESPGDDPHAVTAHHLAHVGADGEPTEGP